MVSLRTFSVAALATAAAAMPSKPRFNSKQTGFFDNIARRQAAAAAAGITDFDILNFALTLEWLETTFYQQGFQKFPPQEFQALGLTQGQLNDLQGIGSSEAEHVEVIQSALAQAGQKPVLPCTYNFNFTTAADMVATAAILENVGVSAYLGAAPLLQDKSILSVAASIALVESRHQTFVRSALKKPSAPSAFDTALDVKNVFSLAAPFIQSCPSGSNLQLQAFPPLALQSNITPALGKPINFNSPPSGAVACAFTNGGQPAGTLYAPFDPQNGCVVPQTLSGITYMNLVSSIPAKGLLTDDITIAGPAVADF